MMNGSSAHGGTSAAPDGIGFAAASLGLALVGFVGGFASPGLVLAAVPGVILGILAEWQMVRAKGRPLGHGLAVAGITLSLFTMGLWAPMFVKGATFRHMYACAANERRLAEAMLMYAEKNDDRLPASRDWADAITPYVSDRETFSCPSAPGKRSGYAFNQALSSIKVADIRDPGHAVMLFESDLGWNASGTASDLPPEPRHDGRDILAFADGHVKAYYRGREAGVVWHQ